MSAASGAAWKERNPEKWKEVHRESQKRYMRRKEIEVTPEEIADRLYHIWGIQDVERWFREAEEREARIWIDKSVMRRLETMDLVPNEPFRLAYQKVPREHIVQVRKSILNELNVMEKLDKQSPNAYGSRSFTDKSLLRMHLGIELRGTVTDRIWQIFLDYRLAEGVTKAMGLCAPEVGV